MRHRLRAELHIEPGSVQRILVATGRYGFEPIDISAHRLNESIEMILDVEGERSAEWLARGLRRLINVRRVEVVTTQQ